MGHQPPTTSLENLNQLDHVCDAFEQAWRSGTSPPKLEDFLSQAPDSPAAQAVWLEELLRLDVHYRLETGESLAADSYVRRFPNQAAVVARVLGECVRAAGSRTGGKDGSTIVTSGEHVPPPAERTNGKTRRTSSSKSSLEDTDAPTPSTAFERATAAEALPPANLAGEWPDNTDDHTIIIDGPQAEQLWGTALPSLPDYKILKLVGRGGMGVVFKARQISLNRTVALKMILSGRLAGSEEIRRFRGEARAAAALRHPNIVAIHEVGEHAGQHYFTMDYVEGCSLAQRIRNRPMQPDQAAQCVEKIARAIDYAHGQGILHRDLKPANVLLDATGTPLVTDFGLAKRMFDDQSLTATDQFLGTLYYAPPEQAQGHKEQIGPTADVYSLGAILYELLTGRPPFKAATFSDTWSQVLNDPPAAPRLLNAKVPKDLETICLKCLAKQPADRYASAGELADDLARYSRGEPVKARRLGPLGKCWRWCKRKPGVAALLLMLLVAAGAVTLAVVLATWGSRQQELRGLSMQFEAALDKVRFDQTYLKHMDALLEKWQQLAPHEAAICRGRFYQQFANAIRREIYRERLDDTDAAAIRRAIAALSACDGEASDLGKALQKELAARLSRPESLFALAAPFDELEDTLGTDHGVQIDGEQLLLDAKHYAKAEPAAIVQTIHPCDGNVELVAEFAPGWQAQPRLGLILGRSTSEGHVQGYEFVLRHTVDDDEPKASSQSDSVPPELMMDSHILDLTKRNYYWLEIYHDGALIQQRMQEADELPDGPLVLRASRRNYQLSFQVNRLPELRFQETFPPIELGVFAVRWPAEQGLLSLTAKRVDAPPEASPLQRGDDLFHRQEYRAALAFYEKQARISPEATVRQEADYKRALCHRHLKQDTLAEEILRQLMHESGEQRWPFMAACELWAMLVEQERTSDAEAVYELVDSRFRFEQLAASVPSSIRQRITSVYAVNLVPLEVFRPNVNRVRDILRLQQIERLFQTGPGEIRQLARLVQAYRYEGDLRSALKVSEELAALAKETDHWLYPQFAYTWCRQLRINGLYDEALKVLNTEYDVPQYRYWQRIERARIHVALGDEAAAEADLRERLQGEEKKNRLVHNDITAYLMLGTLLNKRGQVAEAHQTWRRGLQLMRNTPAPGAYDMMCAHIMGSLLGDWTDEDTRRFFQFAVPNIPSTSLFGAMRDRLLESPDMVSTMQQMWRLKVAQPFVQSLAFDQVPMPERLRLPTRLLATSYLLQSTLGGQYSPEQEQLMWELSGEMMHVLVTHGYDDPQLHAQLAPYMSAWWIGLPSSPLVVQQLPEPLQEGLGYALAHRFLQRGDPSAARRVLEHTAEHASPGSPLLALAELDLSLIHQNEGVLLLPENSAYLGGTLTIKQGDSTVCEVPITGEVRQRLKVGTYEAVIRRADHTMVRQHRVRVNVAGRHTLGANS